MASEANVQRAVWLGLSARLRHRATLFRTNSGKAWLSGAGSAQRRTDGSVLVPAARPVALGLALMNGDTVPGLSDLTGATEVLITQEMVGRKVAVFTVIETKASNGGKKKADQSSFIENMTKAGAIAGFASSVDEANEIIDAWVGGVGTVLR